MTARPLIVALLLASGLSVAQTPGEASLFLAIRKADTAAVKRLLDQGVRADLKDSEGTPALMAATLYSSADLVKLLLDRGANPNVTNAVGATPLMWAIPDLAKVKTLLEHGADVNAKSKNRRRTPLLVAASYPGSVEVLKLLLSKGADLHAKDGSACTLWEGRLFLLTLVWCDFWLRAALTPMKRAMENNLSRLYARHYLPSIEYLQSKGLKMNPDVLPAAAHWHPPQLLEKWIAMGANVNARSAPYQRSALMTAAASEQSTPATLRLLLEKGADPNAEDTEGERPLDWAIYRADQGKIDVLRQFGAKPGKGPRQETYPGPEPGGIADARTSLSRAVSLLLPTAPVVFKQRGCVTCHSQSLVEHAAALARAKGVAVNEELAAQNLNQILSFLKTAAEAAMQGDQPRGELHYSRLCDVWVGRGTVSARQHHGRVLPFGGRPADARWNLVGERCLATAIGGQHRQSDGLGRAHPDSLSDCRSDQRTGREASSSTTLAAHSARDFGRGTQYAFDGFGLDQSIPGEHQCSDGPGVVPASA